MLRLHTVRCRALSPKRPPHRPRPPSDEESDGPSPAGGSPSFLGLQSQAAGSRTRQRTRRRRSSAARELPELNKSEEDFFRDWGISRDREVRGNCLEWLMHGKAGRIASEVWFPHDKTGPVPSPSLGTGCPCMQEVLLSEFRREIEDAVGPLDPTFGVFSAAAVMGG